MQYEKQKHKIHIDKHKKNLGYAQWNASSVTKPNQKSESEEQ